MSWIRTCRFLVGISAAAFVLLSQVASADENGISFWLPGLFGSLAAVPQQPGWSAADIYFHTSVSASGATAASREITIGRFSPTTNVNLNVNLNARGDLNLFVPSYVFATPVFGGQLAVSTAIVYGRTSTDLSGILTGGINGLPLVTRTGSLDESVTGFGDLFPQAALRWNSGVNNYMIYMAGDAPVGAYNSARTANVGIGHGAIDGGAGYTYFNPQKGQEFSIVAGLTYNLENPDTQYQNGIDFHADWAASQFLSKQLFVGAVGYLYNQLTADSGAAPILGSFESRVIGVGPQLGYLFPIGNMQGYLNLKAYWELDAANRPEGWNTWLTLAISPAAPGQAQPPPIIRK